MSVHETQYHYADWVDTQVASGCRAYLMTFMFKELGNARSATKIERMFGDIEVFYGRIVTRFAHRPNAPAERHKLPTLLAAPDRPVAKRDKGALSDAVVNDGLHCHAILIRPKVSRFRKNLLKWVRERHDRLIAGTSLQRIHVVRIRNTPEIAAQYALKAVGGRLPVDNLLILPKEIGATRLRGTDRGYDEACRTVGGGSLSHSRRWE